MLGPCRGADIVPPRAIQLREFFLAYFVWIKQRCHDDESSGPEPRLLDTNTSLTNCELFRKRQIRFPVNGSNGRWLLPTDNMITRAKSFSLSKVSPAMCFVESADKVKSTFFQQDNPGPI